MHKFIPSLFLAATCFLRPHLRAAESPEIAELRRQVETLSKTVSHLQQQVNQQRMAPVFATTPTSPSRSHPHNHAAGEVHHDKSLAEFHGERFQLEIGAVVDAVASYSRRADNLNFVARSVELTLAGKVDEFASAYLTLNAGTELTPTEKTDVFEHAEVELEEAAIETLGLPWGLTAKAGQFFADFTRLGHVHPHDLPFTDRPLSLDRIIGGETKARGLQVAWIPPMAEQFQFTAGVVNGFGEERSITQMPFGSEEEDAVLYRDSGRRSLSDVYVYGRAAAGFDLTPRTRVEVGANVARGREEGERRLASGDVYLRWQPRDRYDDLLEIGGEYLWAQSRGAFADEVLYESSPTSGSSRAHGGYVYAQYRIGKHWQPGIRFDYLSADGWATADFDAAGEADTLHRVSTSARTYSAYLTYAISAANRLRLQVSYLDGQIDSAIDPRDDWQAFLQWTVELGAHDHHHH